MTKTRLFSIAFVCVIVFALLSQMTYALYPTTDPWPMWRHDSARTGTGTSTAPNSNQTIWTWAHSGLYYSPPLLSNGMVFATDGSKVYAIDETDGVQLWNTTFTIQGSIENTPAYSNGIIYFGTTSGLFYSINATNGAEITSYSVSPDTIYTSPVVTNGRVYFGTTDGYIYVLSAATLGYLGDFDAGTAIYSSPAVYQNWLYFGCNNDKVYALNITAATPSLKWEYTTNGTIESTPACGDGMVFVGSSATDHALYALNATTTNVKGQLIWKYVLTNGYAINTSPAFATVGSEQLVFFTPTASDVVYALYANVSPGIYQENNPAIRAWSETVGYTASDPAVANGKVFFGDEGDYNLYAFNATDGITMWKYKFTNYWPGDPIVADGRVFVENYYGLNAFGTSYPPQTYYYKFTVSSQNFVVELVINATPASQLDLSSLVSKLEIGYTLQGIEGNIGMSNITIPNKLLSGPFTVTVDGSSPYSGPTTVSNSTYTSIYFTYIQGSSDTVVITGTSSSVPEFPSVLIIPLLVAVSLLAVAFAKKKLPKK